MARFLAVIALVALSAHTCEHGAGALDPGGRTAQCPKPIAPWRLPEKPSDRSNRTLLESERFRQEIFIGSLVQQLLPIGAPPAASAGLEVANRARAETPSPEVIVNRASDAIGPVTPGRFVTLCYMRLDPTARRVTLVDCGDPSTPQYQAGPGKVVALPVAPYRRFRYD